MPTKAQSEHRKKLKEHEFTSKQSRTEAAKNGRKGGIASGEARREKKIIKDEILKRMNESDWNEMMINMIERAKGTDKGFEVFRDSIGQKPAQEVNLTSDAEEFEFTFKYSK